MEHSPVPNPPALFVILTAERRVFPPLTLMRARERGRGRGLIWHLGEVDFYIGGDKNSSPLMTGTILNCNSNRAT